MKDFDDSRKDDSLYISDYQKTHKSYTGGESTLYCILTEVRGTLPGNYEESRLWVVTTYMEYPENENKESLVNSDLVFENYDDAVSTINRLVENFKSSN